MEEKKDILGRLEWESLDSVLSDAIRERDDNLRQMREHNFGGFVTVRVKVSFENNGICIPDSYGEDEEYAVFRRVTVNDSFEFDALAMKQEFVGKDPNGEPVYERSMDLNEYRRLLIMKNLLEWSLDIPLDHDYDGWLTDSSWDRVSRVSAPLLDAFVQGFEQSNVVTEDEQSLINKQSLILFGKNSKGVSEACDAVSKYCTYGNFGEKFNLSIEEIKNLPYREYILLKMMISNEGEAMRNKLAAPARQKSNTRISTGRGARPSRGVVQPMPGSQGTY